MKMYAVVHKLVAAIIRILWPLKYASILGVKYGDGCKFIRPNFGTEPYLISMGNHVEITNNVQFITHDGGVWCFRENEPDIDIFGPIIIGDNVFIGINSVILPNVTIGNNVIIGAGSVVASNVEKNTVVGGTPARFICDLDTYYNKNQDNYFQIKNKSPREKRSYLENYFNLKQ